MGSALRTISLRLRGTSVEMLEEMGEETDGVVESTSKLQEKLKALTGVDILTDAGEYKDTYTILKEIGEVWPNLDPMDQAAALELMAGKNRANTLAAILNNMEDLEGAYESAMGAEGSAMRENETYLDSIQGRIDLFNNAVQTMWMNLLNDEAVKFIVDLGTAIIKLIDKVGILVPSLIGVVTYFTAIKKHNPVTMFKDLVANIQKYNVAVQQIKDINSMVGSPVSTMSLGTFNAGPVNAYAAAVSNLTAKQQAATLAASGLNSEQIASVLAANNVEASNIRLAMSEAGVAQAKTQTTAATGLQIAAAMKKQGVDLSQNATNFLLEHSTENVTEEMLANAVAAGTITHQEEALIMKSGAVVAANNTQAFSWKALGTAIKGAFMSNPIGMILTLVTTIASIAIPIIESFTKSAEDLAAEVEEMTEKYKAAKQELSENIETLTISSDIDRYDTLIDEFRMLTEGVNSYGENLNLTSDAYERYKQICESIVKINPSIAEGYDSATAAIGNNVSMLSNLLELQERQQRLNASEYLSYGVYSDNDNLEDLWDAATDSSVKSLQTRSKAYGPLRMDSVRNSMKGLTYYTVNANPDLSVSALYDNTDDFAALMTKLMRPELSDEAILTDLNRFWRDDDGYEYAHFDFTDWYYAYSDEIYENRDAIKSAMLNLEHTWRDTGLINEKELMKYMLTHEFGEANLSAGDAEDELSKYQTNGQFDYDKFLSQSEYAEYVPDFQAKWANNLANEFMTKMNTIHDAEMQVESSKNALIDTYLQAPLLSLEYGELNNGSRSFVSNWIKNSGKFKTYSDTTMDTVKSNRDRIVSEVNNLATGYYSVDTGTDEGVLTAQDIIDQIFSVNPSDYNYGEYKAYINERLNLLWESIGGTGNTFGFDSQRDLAVQFGLEFIIDEENEQMERVKTRLAELTGETPENIQAWLDSQPPRTVQAILEFDWSAEQAGNLTYEDIVNKAMPKAASSLLVHTQTYSVLTESVDAFNEVLTTSEELLVDGVKTNKEYYESLLDMGIAEADLAECIDKHNGYIVTNADELNKLVKFSRKNTEQNIKLAKSQAKLEYYELYKEMKKLTNGTRVTDAATLDHINSLYSQMSALQKTIAQYSLLEAKLLGTSNAYEKLAEAQEIDSEQDYGSKAEELVNVLANAFNTSELGTEAAQVAIAGLIPEDEIDKAKTLDEQMQQIYEYFTGGTVSKLFTIEFDDNGGISSVEMTKENVEEFTKSLMGEVGSDAVFQGTWDEFTLNPAIKTMDDFSKALGVTKEVAFAYLTELEKFDIGWLGGDNTTLLDQLMGEDLEYQIYNTTQKLAELEYQLATGAITASEYREALYGSNGLSAQSDALAESAREDAAAWYDKNQQLQDATDRLAEYNKQLETGRDSNGDVVDADQVQANIDTTMGEITTLIEELSKLEEPTEITLQFANDKIQQEMDDIEAEIGDVIENTHYKLDVSTGKYTVMLDETDPNYQKVVDFVNLLNEQHIIEAQMGGNTPTVIDKLSEIAGILEDIANVLKVKYEIDVDTNDAFKNTKSFKELWDTISSKSVTLTQSVKTVAESIKDKVKSFFKPSGANGTAHVKGTAYKGGSWGAPRTETALTGELGPELRVRGNRWELLGENGAEFNEVRKGDIIFNHKQTEQLLSNGYITGRGKAFAEGTIGGSAFAKIDTWDDAYGKINESYSNTAGEELSEAAEDLSDAADEFREVFDWIEVRIEEINEDISLKSAELENAVGAADQNSVIDNMIALNQKLYDNLTAGASKYDTYAKKLLEKVPDEYKKAAQDGSIAIEEFVNKADEETLNAIQEYREWVQKGADATQQAEETLTEIQNLAKQAIDNIAQEYENEKSIHGIKLEQLEAYNSLIETDIGSESAKIYEAMIKENNKQIELLVKQRNQMQAELNAQVEAGNIKKYSQAWYDAVNDIAAVDTEIIDLTTDTEDYQDSLNELHWDHFDNLMSRFEAISDEAENLIDILSNKDLVDKDTAEWTDEGITSLGLYAQQMEVAEMQAEKYKEEIQYLNKNWKKLGYTEQEYVEKLEELKEGQYDAINAYNDTKDAIVDLTSERVDAIKEGIEKEIEAYEELIDKKKEELDAEKDLYDFQKGVANQQKEIADIERKLAALSADNSASARAKRAQLQAELLEAQQELEDTYYDRSISDQQEALDKELEAFQEEKDKEIEGWEKYLEDTEAVVADGLATIQNNTDAVYNTLQEMGEEYSLSIADALTSPWKYGEDAIQSYSEKFKMDMSKTVEELKKIAKEHKQLIDEIEKHGSKDVGQVNNNVAEYTDAEKGKKESGGGKSSAAGMVSSLSGDIQYGQSGANVKKLQKALNALGFNCGSVDGIFGDKTYAAVMAFQKSSKFGGAISADGIVGPNTKKKFKVAGYAGGTTGVKNDQWALIDELGEELVIRPSNGRMTFMEKGTGVVPADLTSNLMGWGELDPSIMLERNKPVISATHITNNNMEVNMEIAEVVHVDHVDSNNLPDLTKAVEKQLDKYMKDLNAQIRRKTNR